MFAEWSAVEAKGSFTVPRPGAIRQSSRPSLAKKQEIRTIQSLRPDNVCLVPSCALIFIEML